MAITAANKTRIKVCLLGSSFDTSNMGVRALAAASIKCIWVQRPGAELTLLASGRAAGYYRLRLGDKIVTMRRLPVRFCTNIFRCDHFCFLALCALMVKILPWKWVKDVVIAHNPCAKAILEANYIFDITGGDSFSDIYGMRRFMLDFLRKWLILYFGKRLILLPQTYGPFNNTITMLLAKYIVKRAFAIYARDRESVEYVKNLLNNGKTKRNNIRFVPDVAFVLNSYKPKITDITSLLRKRARNMVLVGMNVSGLLFFGGYTRNNMFRLQVDYPRLVYDIIETLMKNKNILLLLIPHVFDAIGSVESDLDACSQLYQKVSRKYTGRIFLTECSYDQSEIKYIIGQCDFFLGSRMHSCIAALSQNVPTIGLAYSKKFHGVFDSIGVGGNVIDLRTETEDGILHGVEKALSCRNEIAQKLAKTIPKVKEAILNCFENIS